MNCLLLSVLLCCVLHPALAADSSILGQFWRNAARFTDSVNDRSIIKNILENILNQVTGNQSAKIDVIEIDSKNRLEKLVLNSNVLEPTFTVEDSTKLINIKNLTLPIKLFSLEGYYNFQELVLPGGLTIYGNGKLRIRVDDLKIFTLLNMSFSSANGFRVKDVAADVSLEKFLVEFENLMDGEPMGDFIHAMIRDMIPVLIDLLPDLISENKKEVMEFISEILNSVIGS